MKRAGIIGIGKAGLSIINLFEKLGYKIFASDIKKFPESFKRKLSKNVFLEEEINSEKILMNDIIIASPGISEKNLIIKRIREKRIPLLDEIEIGYRFTYGKKIAVTGTNGKSTVVKWIYECIKDKNAFIAGNIGTPLTRLAFRKGIFIIEVSSFQLRRIELFKPDIGMILNIDKDHMDWHISQDEYFFSKLNIFKNQKESDFLILDEQINLPRNIKPKAEVLKVSMDKEIKGVFLRKGKVIFRLEDEEEEWEFKFPLKGKFNIKNGLFVLLTLRLLGENMKRIKEKFENFKGLPHRLEYIGEKKGVEVYNDSKSTNPHAVKGAIESFEKPLILIMGGLNKGLSFRGLKNLLEKKCKGVVLFGKSRFEIFEEIKDVKVNMEITETVETALKKAFSIAAKGDVVLFSPGCASFDKYKNYAERGEDFKNAFRKI